jgi:hypothetical protein
VTESRLTMPNFLDGSSAAAEDGRTADVVDPGTGEARGTAPVSGPEDVDAASRAAAPAFQPWRGTTPSDRPPGAVPLRRTASLRGPLRAVLCSVIGGCRGNVRRIDPPRQECFPSFRRRGLSPT